MKIKNSPLELLNFFVRKSVYSFEQPEGQEEIDPDQMTENYELDFDYFIKTNGEGFYIIFTKVVINDGGNKMPGHTIFVEAVNIFRINPDYPDTPRAEDIQALINFSAVTLAFSNVRGYIADLTSYSPSGRYLFPVFDLQHLIKSKQEQIVGMKKEKKEKKEIASEKNTSKKKKPISNSQIKKGSN